MAPCTPTSAATSSCRRPSGDGWWCVCMQDMGGDEVTGITREVQLLRVRPDGTTTTPRTITTLGDANPALSRGIQTDVDLAPDGRSGMIAVGRQTATAWSTGRQAGPGQGDDWTVDCAGSPGGAAAPDAHALAEYRTTRRGTTSAPPGRTSACLGTDRKPSSGARSSRSPTTRSPSPKTSDGASPLTPREPRGAVGRQGFRDLSRVVPVHGIRPRRSTRGHLLRVSGPGFAGSADPAADRHRFRWGSCQAGGFPRPRGSSPSRCSIPPTASCGCGTPPISRSSGRYERSHRDQHDVRSARRTDPRRGGVSRRAAGLGPCRFGRQHVRRVADDRIARRQAPLPARLPAPAAGRPRHARKPRRLRRRSVDAGARRALGAGWYISSSIETVLGGKVVAASGQGGHGRRGQERALAGVGDVPRRGRRPDPL